MNKIKSIMYALVLLALVYTGKLCAQTATAQDSLQIKSGLSKEEKNRNVMLNAADNTGPRDVNIGLPSSVGGITILENDLPVVYFYWPELPNRTWRQSEGLQNTGLLKMGQVANTFGDLGFAVNSYTRTGSQDFHFRGKFSGSHYGWIQADVNVTGPISSKGWTYSLGAFVNFDPSTYDLKFANYSDKTQIYRAGITKYLKDEKGQFSVFYKYAKSSSLNNFSVFEYGANGTAKELDDFTIGRDSYIVNDGLVRVKDILTGEFSTIDLDGDKVASESHTFDVFGNYQLSNNWNLKYTARAHFAKASLAYSIPLSIFEVNEEEGFTYESTGENYEGKVSSQLTFYTPKVPVTNIAGRLSVEKHIGDHEVTIGLLEQYYNVDQFTSQRSFFYQSVSAQPDKLKLTEAGSTYATTDEYGFYYYNIGGEYHNGYENKLLLYASDTWKVNPRLKVNYGAGVRYNRLKGDYNPASRTSGFVFDPAEKVYFENNWLHFSGMVNGSYNLTRDFGFLANFQYTEENNRLENYSAAHEPNQVRRKSPMGALGVFWSGDKISLVSQATYLTRNNYLTRLNLVNPEDGSQSEVASVTYDIQTIGWTTDIVVKLFGGFNLHYLITLQDPVYKNYGFSAFGNDYSYDNKNVLEISKVLMEIDPSYTLGKWRVWASFRYFSRQYANLTNALYFKSRWETFGGVSYKPTKHIDFGVNVVNFLNLRGAKGTINGAELITDPSLYYGQLLTGSYIRPFTVQTSVKFHF